MTLEYIVSNTGIMYFQFYLYRYLNESIQSQWKLYLLQVRLQCSTAIVHYSYKSKTTIRKIHKNCTFFPIVRYKNVIIHTYHKYKWSCSFVRERSGTCIPILHHLEVETLYSMTLNTVPRLYYISAAKKFVISLFS